MLISAPRELDVPSNLSAKFRKLPALIDVYVLVVDQVMRKQGFDQERCEFTPEETLPQSEYSLESSAHALSRCCFEPARMESIHSRPKAELLSRYQPTNVSCELELLVAAC